MQKLIQHLALLALLLSPPALLVAPLTAVGQSLPLMPYPQQVIAGEGHLLLNNNLHLDYQGGDALIEAALARFETRFNRQTRQALRISRDHQQLPQLKIQVNSKQPLSNSLSDWNESYQLAIVGQQIQINAQQNIGVLRALETLLQLVSVSPKNAAESESIKIPRLIINDAPRFTWRGLLIDCSRHFFSLDTLKRQLDVMAAAKLNVFHWHLTDDQGWRFESRAYPRLQQKASGGEFYTQAQMRELVAYARARGIAVLPEIDLPGHASAIAVAYPELMAAPGPYAMTDTWGVHQPTLDPSNPAVYKFADELFAELRAIFPFEYVHIGGDEVDPSQWLASARIQQFMVEQHLADPQALQAYFNQRLYQLLKKHQRKMIGWDEILHPKLPRDIVVQSWRGPDAVSAAVSQGFNALLSTGYYLDQPQSAAYHYRQDPIPPVPYQPPALSAGEQMRSWRFSIARQRGAPITGSFTLIQSSNHKPAQGFIDFEGKSRRPLTFAAASANDLAFGLDTWMGPLQFQVDINDGKLSGQVIIGNAPYPLSVEPFTRGNIPGASVAPAKVFVPALTDRQQQLVRGGEAALWSELVDEQTIDSRLWPRAFAVAERLWSAADWRDESSLYNRLETTMTWARRSTDLADKKQQQQALLRLAGHNGYPLLASLAQALEPAQYYYRQHQKSAQASYSRADSLEQLVDALPVESNWCRHLEQLVDDWQADKNPQKAAEIATFLQTWLTTYPKLAKLLQSREVLKPLLPLAQSVKDLFSLGLAQVQAQTADSRAPGALSGADTAQQAVLFQAHQVHQEMLICAAGAVQKLVQIPHNSQ